MNRLTDEFIESNMGLVHSLANRFKGRGIEYEELFSAGCMGLVKAAKGFDEERGLCFSTYAVPVILGEIKRLFRDGGTVKVSRSLKELSFKIMRWERAFGKRNRRLFRRERGNCNGSDSLLTACNFSYRNGRERKRIRYPGRSATG